MKSQSLNSKTINLLTICRRAGKIIMGYDSVKEAVFTGKVCCVCTVNDISPKTLKEAEYICSRNNIPILKLNDTMDDIWGALGKKVGIIAVLDDGFTKRLTEILKE